MPSRLVRTALFLLFGIALGLASDASATTVAKLGLREMTAASSTVIHGTVVSTRCRWNEDRSLILTDVRVRVDDALKGSAAATVTVVQLGGTIGKLQVDVPGAAAFRPGEEAILFLVPDSRGDLHVAGLSQGRFEVVRNPRSGSREVLGLEEAIPAAGAPAVGGVQVLSAPAAPTGPVPLDRFLGDIRSLIRDVDAQGGK